MITKISKQGKKLKTKRSKRPKKSKKVPSKEILAIMLIAFSIVAVIVGIIVYQQLPKGSKIKKDANEYFQFLDTSALAKRTSEKVIRINYLFFKLVPVGGDAHHVVIFAEGMANPENYYYSEIKNGTEQNVEIQFFSPIQSVKQGNVYPITIRIRSDEAEGSVTLYLKEEDIIFSP